MAMRRFVVQFSKIGNAVGEYSRFFEAPNVRALEPEIQAFVDSVLGEDAHAEVTLEPLSMKGQINYGLLGNFDITDPADG